MRSKSLRETQVDAVTKFAITHQNKNWTTRYIAVWRDSILKRATDWKKVIVAGYAKRVIMTVTFSFPILETECEAPEASIGAFALQDFMLSGTKSELRCEEFPKSHTAWLWIADGRDVVGWVERQDWLNIETTSEVPEHCVLAT